MQMVVKTTTTPAGGTATTTTETLNFTYDASGMPMSVKYDNTTYYYVVNIQGDIMAILNTSGEPVVQYNYDAWGKLHSFFGSMEDTLGEVNPLTYRGYVTDREIGMFYLQSRYYAPDMGRFINADCYASTTQGMLGNNMFSYGKNCPIILKDSEGESATVAGGIVGGIFGFISAVMSEVSDDEEDGKNGIRWDKVWDCTISSAITGAAAGFVADVSIATCGAGTAIFISAAGGAITSAVNSAYTQYSLKGDVDAGKVVSDALIGGFANGLCTGTSSCLDPVVSGLKNGLQYAGSQVAAEFIPGFVNVASFVVNDLIPTVITGFGGWCGGIMYDYYSTY